MLYASMFAQTGQRFLTLSILYALHTEAWNDEMHRRGKRPNGSKICHAFYYSTMHPFLVHIERGNEFNGKNAVPIAHSLSSQSLLKEMEIILTVCTKCQTHFNFI
jgi:hypothetical protein